MRATGLNKPFVSRDYIAGEVKRVINEQLGLDCPDGDPGCGEDDCLYTGLNADSLDIIELAIGIEVEFDISLTDAETEAMNRVGDIIDLVYGKVT